MKRIALFLRVHNHPSERTISIFILFSCSVLQILFNIFCFVYIKKERKQEFDVKFSSSVEEASSEYIHHHSMH